MSPGTAAAEVEVVVGNSSDVIGSVSNLASSSGSTAETQASHWLLPIIHPNKPGPGQVGAMSKAQK